MRQSSALLLYVQGVNSANSIVLHLIHGELLHYSLPSVFMMAFTRLGRPVTALSRPIYRLMSTEPNVNPRVGIIGIGNVGAAVAHNLLKSKQRLTSVYDVCPEALRTIPENITRAGSAREVAEMSDVVLTALPAPPDVKKALQGDDGVLRGLREGGVWIDHSTTDYHQTLALGAEAKERGIKVLEAPVTGGMALLRQGKMTVLVGGERELYENCKPILQQVGCKVIYLGPLGAATITKVISNMLAATNTVATGEALMLAKRAGIDLKSCFDAIRFSAGNSFVWETEAPLVFNGTYDPHFAVELHTKDLNLGYELSRSLGAPIMLHGLVEQIYNRARLKYGNQVGSSCPPKLQEDELQESLQREGFDDWTYTIEEFQDSMVVVHQKSDDAKQIRKESKNRFTK